MEIFSLDIETTGPDPETDQVLHIAMVRTSTENLDTPLKSLEKWEALIRHDRIHGDAFELNMNADLLETLAFPLVPGPNNTWAERVYRGRDIPVFRTLHQALEHLYTKGPFADYWVRQNRRKIIIAGKNAAGFDIPFLAQAGGEFKRRIHHRVIDVGSVAMGASLPLWDRDAPPSICDLTQEAIAHDAYVDALDTIFVLRKIWRGLP